MASFFPIRIHELYIYIMHFSWEASAALLSDDVMAAMGADVAQQPRLSLAFPTKEEDVGGRGGRKGGKGGTGGKGGKGDKGGRGGGGGDEKPKSLDFFILQIPCIILIGTTSSIHQRQWIHSGN